MPLQVTLSEPVAREVRELVALGAYANERVAVEELVRLGLASRRGPVPRPPMPPPARDPGDDRPIEVDPGHDVNWAGGVRLR